MCQRSIMIQELHAMTRLRGPPGRAPRNPSQNEAQPIDPQTESTLYGVCVLAHSRSRAPPTPHNMHTEDSCCGTLHICHTDAADTLEQP